jgi:hypothetical protein
VDAHLFQCGYGYSFYLNADPDRVQGAKLGSVSWPDFEVTKSRIFT